MWINARVVCCAVDSDPVGLLDSAFVSCCWAKGKSAGYLDPASLFFGNQSDFVSHFGEVLILAEDEDYRALSFVGGTNDVQSKTDVNAFLSANKKRVFAAVR